MAEQTYEVDLGDIVLGIAAGGAIAVAGVTSIPIILTVSAIAALGNAANEYLDAADQPAFAELSAVMNQINDTLTVELGNLNTALADILTELQKIGICACAEGEGGSDAGTGTGPAVPGVTRLSVDASAFVFQIGKFLSGVKRALCIGKSRVWKFARAGLAG
jgi:hypothetical protein